MRNLKQTTQYKKDLKKIRNNPKKAQALFSVLDKLMREDELPTEYKPHPLTGNYSGFMECHVLNDFLLIWLDEKTGDILLVRLGSHSELFG